MGENGLSMNSNGQRRAIEQPYHPPTMKLPQEEVTSRPHSKMKNSLKKAHLSTPSLTLTPPPAPTPGDASSKPPSSPSPPPPPPQHQQPAMGYSVSVSHPTSENAQVVQCKDPKANQMPNQNLPPTGPTLTPDHQVFISIHHRGELSLDESRRDLGSSAYHWGVLLAPRNPKSACCHAFDVTDGSSPDRLLRMDNNPNFEWRFRVRYYVNPDHSGSLLLRIKVGKVKMGSGNGNGNGNGAGANAFENIHAILRSIPLPAKGAAGPRQNCVGWIRAAIRKLQANGLAEEFDVDAFMANALAFVDRRLADVDRVPDVIDHLGKRI